MNWLPDLFIYNGTVFFVVGLAVIPQRRFGMALILFLASITMFGLRLTLDRRTNRQVVA